MPSIGASTPSPPCLRGSIGARRSVRGKPASAPEAASLAADLRRSVSGFVRAIRQDTGTIRSAQSETLDLLEKLGPMNVATLADRRGVTHQTMRLVVAQLEAAALVRQAPNPADRRSRLVSIAQEGVIALERERAARTSRIQDAIEARLSGSEREVLRAAITILDRLAAGGL
jgi:DNA-binding MarR family transcriptional regulator